MLSAVCLDIQVVSFRQVSPPNPHTFFFCMCTTYATHLILLRFITQVMFSEDYKSWSSSVYSFSSSLLLASFFPNILLTTLFSMILNLNVRDQVANQQKKLVLCILIVMLLDNRWKDEISWIKWQQACTECNWCLMSSSIQFCFVGVTPNYLNFGTCFLSIANIFTLILF